MDALHEKKAALTARLRAYGRLLVAFSAGVDSTFLLAAAQEALGENVLAVSAQALFVPAREQEEAVRFCQARGIRHHLIRMNYEEIPNFTSNPPDRCYFCKKAIFSAFLEEARRNDIPYVAEGSNLDDLSDYRPGLKAIQELGIVSPLKEAGLGKADIRALSREMGLPSWNKPSFACLASRFVYGESITLEKLQRIEQAEDRLLSLGFTQFRVRLHGDMARIELLPEEMTRLMDPALREEIRSFFHQLGFVYVTLDLDGFRSGSMNRTLKQEP